MTKWKERLPGLLFVLVLAVLSKQLESFMGPWFRLEALTIGILAGMLLNNVHVVPAATRAGNKYALKTLLKVGIVLLGFKLNVEAITQLGAMTTLTVVGYVPLVMVLAWGIGRATGVSGKLSALIGVGSSICGASAIVALAPCVHADDDEAVLAVSVVSFLGAVGVLTYTAVEALPLLTDAQYGIWSGLSLHGVAHALAAAFARGDAAGNLGTFVKMERVLMMVPMSVLLSWLFRKEGSGKRAPFPMYVFGFIATALISMTGVLPQGLTVILAKTSSWLILMAMIGMGLSVTFSDIRDKGGKAVLAGALLFVVVATTSFLWTRTVF